MQASKNTWNKDVILSFHSLGVFSGFARGFLGRYLAQRRKVRKGGKNGDVLSRFSPSRPFGGLVRGGTFGIA
jgi:hypothetical protein